MGNAIDKIDDFLQSGGFFNPELMDPRPLRDVMLEVRDEIQRLTRELDSTKESLNVANERIHSNWAYHRWWEEKFVKYLDKIKEWEDKEYEKEMWGR